MKNNLVFFKKSDILIISAIILILGGFSCFRHFRSGNKIYAEISVDGKTVDFINLSENDNKEFTEQALDGVIFETDHGKIKIKSSDCPQQICVNTSYISSPGETIVCLPKKLIIKICDGNIPSQITAG